MPGCLIVLGLIALFIFPPLGLGLILIAIFFGVAARK
jgi:hypothetical protein